ncbi:FAD-dependent oxidoreductase [Sinosporangium siamense]|uniref:FAD-dependent oxidoreductase n=2 Tax=Sinosporangium siamense TaxID=1367973 RepID=A0A919RLR9_9ACTN|nr:FAD-dependent oxidoreductase [Sinosporangium siamense]
MRVVVAGAGLGGVGAAVGLHRQGHEVTLFERGAELREKGTAIVLLPNGVRALDSLGLAGYARDHPLPPVSGGMRDRNGRPLLVTDVAKAQSEMGAGASVSRAELHRALRDPLPPELVRTGTAIDRLDSGDDEVSVVSGGRVVARADAAIVADGIGSVLRGHLFPGHPGVRRVGRLDLRGMLPAPANLDYGGLLTSNLLDRRTGAMFGLYPVGEDLLYWFTDQALRGPVPGAEQARRGVLSLMSDWHPVVPALIEATALDDIYIDPIARLAEPLPAYAVGRIALIGDAAHAMTPDLGQGASQAFMDAASVTRHLAGAGPADVVRRLRGYDAERRPRANRVMEAASRQGWLTSRTGAGAWLRDAMLRAIPTRVATRALASMWKADYPAKSSVKSTGG